MPICSIHSRLSSPFRARQPWLKNPLAHLGLLASALLLSACSPQAPEHPLRYAPANSLFVAANLEPLPEAARQFQSTVSAPLKALWAQWYPLLQKDLAKDEHKAHVQRFLDYLSDTLSAQGLAGFGIAPDALYAFYEVELHPVLRLNLSEPAKLRQLITEIETLRGHSFNMQQLEGLTYWRIPLSGIKPQQLVDQVEKLSPHTLQDALPDLEQLPQWSGSDSPTTAPQLLLAISDKDLVLTFERPSDAALRPKLLGIEKPASNMWEAKTLQKVNERHGLTPYGTFWLESARVLQLAGIAPETASAKEQEQAKQRSVIHTSLSGACVRELTHLAAQVPELAVGVTQMNETLFKAKMSLALEPTVREDWRRMQAPLQGSQQSQPSLMELGVSLRIDMLAAWLQKTINAVNAKPFECDQLHALNEIAKSPKATQMLAPMYMVSSTASGFYARLTGLQMHDDTPIPEGLVLAQSVNPRGLLSYLSMATPGLAQMNIQPGMAPQPITLPSEEWQAFNIPTFVALSGSAMGIAAGDAAAGQLHSLLAQAETEPAPFSFSRYSGAFFADTLEPIMSQAYEQYEVKAQQAQQELAEHAGSTVPDAAAQQQAQELKEQTRQAMRTAWNWVRLFQTVGDATTVGPQGLEYQFFIQLQAPKQ